MKEQIGKSIVIGICVSLCLFLIIGIWDIWDDTNEAILDKVWGTDTLIFFVFLAAAWLFGKYLEFTEEV